MFGAITPNDAQVIVAAIALVGVIITAVISAVVKVTTDRASKMQRGDHALTADKVDELLVGQREMREDLRDLKDETRSHGDRLRHLERWAVVRDDNTEVIDKLDHLSADVVALTNRGEQS